MLGHEGLCVCVCVAEGVHSLRYVWYAKLRQGKYLPRPVLLNTN